jgi:hypothetical protein
MFNKNIFFYNVKKYIRIILYLFWFTKNILQNCLNLLTILKKALNMTAFYCEICLSNLHFGSLFNV